MEKIDRLGWADGMSFVARGARIGIRVNDPTALERIPRHLPPQWKPSSSPVVDDLYSIVLGSDGRNSRIRRYNLLYAGATRLARTMDFNVVCAPLS